jgi:hypothetical protein
MLVAQFGSSNASGRNMQRAAPPNDLPAPAPASKPYGRACPPFSRFEPLSGGRHRKASRLRQVRTDACVPRDARCRMGPFAGRRLGQCANAITLRWRLQRASTSFSVDAAPSKLKATRHVHTVGQLRRPESTAQITPDIDVYASTCVCEIDSPFCPLGERTEDLPCYRE